MTKVISKNKWLALAAIALGVSLIIMDATVVNVALPVIIRDLKLDAVQAEWINAIYSLVLASPLLAVGRIGDIFGRRKLFLVGILLFVLASVSAGFSMNGTWLIASRFAQGLGAAIILPSTLSIINAMFDEKGRAIAFAVWGATIGGMAAIGPLVGGWLTTDFSWRWIFFMNVPVGMLVLAVIVMYVPESRDEQTPRKLDFPGLVLSIMGMGSIVYALIESQTYGWFKQLNGSLSPAFIALIVGVLLMALFVYYQLGQTKKHKAELINLNLLSIKSFRYGSIAALIVALGEFGMLFALPLLVQNALGFSALKTGVLIVSLAVGTFLISGTTPQLIKRFGRRFVVRLGLGFETIAIALLSLTLSSNIQGWEIAIWLFIYGIGVGMATSQLTNIIMAEVPKNQSGQASGLQSTFRQLGSTLGIALLGGFLIFSLGRHTNSNLKKLDSYNTHETGTVQAIKKSAGTIIPSLKNNPHTKILGDAASKGLISASRTTTGVASVVILIGLIATFAIPKESKPVNLSLKTKRV